jgi:hypothetical protein
MRTAEIDRNTLETQISVSVNLDGSGAREFQTGLPFLDHMLDQVARHGLLDITNGRGTRPAHVGCDAFNERQLIVGDYPGNRL